MSSVLDRDELIASPLADLHLIANELGLDGFRRLRKADLVEALIARQAGEAPPVPEAAAGADDVEAAAIATDAEPAAEAGDEDAGEEERRPRRRSRGGRSRSRSRSEDAVDADAGDQNDEPAETPAVAPAVAAAGGNGGEALVEGVVELLANGSGFLRLNHPEVGDDDVYVSAAQIKRCELVSGDRISGPVRSPRRSERHPSLVRVTTINGRSADEVAEGTRFEDLRAIFPSEALELGGELELVDRLSPIGKGSRVAIAGEPHTGKSELLRRAAQALAGRGGVEVIVALAGTRPEEVGEWSAEAGPAPVAVAPLGSAPEAQIQAVEQAIEHGRRVAARSGDAVVIADALDQVPAPAARKALSAARNLADAGSLTVLAALRDPVGGETTVVRLDPLLAATGRFPAISPVQSFTMRSELLVGEKEAERARKARAKA